jgi:hypothetical protein
MEAAEEEFRQNAEPTAAWARRWNVVATDSRDCAGPTRTYSGAVGFVRVGWIPILDRLAEDLIALGWDRTLDQVKQKLGGLRFYPSRRDPTPLSADARAAISRRIDSAIEESLNTCEECSAPGRRCDPGGRDWLETLCARCFEAEDAEVRALMAEDKRRDAEAEAVLRAEEEELAKNDPEYRAYLEEYVYPRRGKHDLPGSVMVFVELLPNDHK